jgi:hypothetical protein
MIIPLSSFYHLFRTVFCLSIIMLGSSCNATFDYHWKALEYMILLKNTKTIFVKLRQNVHFETGIPIIMAILDVELVI